MKLTHEQVADIVSRGTTDHGKVDCFYLDDVFALVKWPGGSYWSGFSQQYASPHVDRYEMSDLLEAAAKKRGAFGSGYRVHDCARDADGPLTKSKKRILVENERRYVTPSKTIQKLRTRLNRELDAGIPRRFHFNRLYPGHWQRSAGAWSWRITWNGKPAGEVGSTDPVKMCLDASSLSWGEYGTVYAEP